MSIETEKSSKPIRVLVCDDSAVLRGILTHILEQDKNIKVVATAANGQIAVSEVGRNDIDLVVLDIEMPVMDGLTALPLILEANKHVKVLIASTLTSKNAEISMKALELGATDYLTKPSTGRDVGNADDFKRDLLAKVLLLGHQVHVAKAKAAGQAKAPSAPQADGKIPGIVTFLQAAKATQLVTHPSKPYKKPDIIAIGSSTGGPQALFTVMKGLYGKVHNQPIVITQHMPATFTAILANHIKQQSGFEAFEAEEGMVLENGKVYVAPGNYHMTFKVKDGKTIVALNQNDPVNYCRPAVDVMLDSLNAIYGDRTLAIILTGMGHDGRDGSKKLFERGACILAQDEKTSVVWGMPGAVAVAGICKKIVPIDDMAKEIAEAAN